jgi:chromosome segregation ATPase
MAKPADNLREAVERTVEATLGSAERSRSAAQGALDDLVDSVEELRKGAEERLARGREALEGRRPATYDDVKELRAELRAIGRRLDRIEERLPKRRSSAGSTSKRSSGSASKRSKA